MARDFAKSFYNSAAWKHTSKAYGDSVFWICERCGHEGNIIHHKKYLNPNNIDNPDITLSWDNLMCVCTECHNIIHGYQQERQPVFDESGQLIALAAAVKPPLS